MEPLSKEKVKRKKEKEEGQSDKHVWYSRWRLATVFSFSFFLFPFSLLGCVTLDAFQDKDRPPTGIPCHVVATWKNQVYWTPDPTRGGAPAPGLAGRLYLFGKEVGYPISATGCVVVDLYDSAPMVSGRPPVLLEEWRFDKDTLARLLHKDGIGWGYTIFLPWGTYRPDLRTVQFRLRFEAEGRTPLYAEISQVLLQEESRPIAATVPTPTLPAPRPVEPPRSQSFNLAREEKEP